MRSIVTMWAYVNYDNDEPQDNSELFSMYVDAGWHIVSVSSCLDMYEGRRIIVLTALLEK